VRPKTLHYTQEIKMTKPKIIPVLIRQEFYDKIIARKHYHQYKSHNPCLAMLDNLILSGNDLWLDEPLLWQYGVVGQMEPKYWQRWLDTDPRLHISEFSPMRQLIEQLANNEIVFEASIVPMSESREYFKPLKTYIYKERYGMIIITRLSTN
jgi:hypothetical protein